MPAIVAACADPAITHFLDAVPQPYSDADGLAYVELTEQGWRDATAAQFAMTARADELLGSIGVGFVEPARGLARVGYWTAPAARGRGLTTRALVLISRWAIRDAGVERLELEADVENIASQRVAERAGFTREGVMRSARPNARLGRRVDIALFSLLPADLASK